MNHAEVIRKAVIEVNPPKQREALKTAGEVNTEIAALCPFWAPLLRNRDLRDTEGGDEYIQGLIETFARIYVALRGVKQEQVLSVLDDRTLFAVDEAMAAGDLGIEQEYPVLNMMNVQSLGSFGAGIYAAYGLLEMAIASAVPVTGQEAAPESPQSSSDLADAMDGLLAEVEPPRSNAVKPSRFTKVAVGDEYGVSIRPVAAAEPVAKKMVARPIDGSVIPVMPVLTLNIYDVKNGFKIVGDLAPTLGTAARAHEILVRLFGVDASLGVRGDESRGAAQIQVSFAVLEK